MFPRDRFLHEMQQSINAGEDWTLEGMELYVGIGGVLEHSGIPPTDYGKLPVEGNWNLIDCDEWWPADSVREKTKPGVYPMGDTLVVIGSFDGVHDVNVLSLWRWVWQKT